MIGLEEQRTTPRGQRLVTMDGTFDFKRKALGRYAVFAGGECLGEVRTASSHGHWGWVALASGSCAHLVKHGSHYLFASRADAADALAGPMALN